MMKDKRMITGQMALLAASAFASACLYINVVEQPARLDLEANALLREWKLSYKRGTVMQVSLSVTAATLGVISFATEHDWRWLGGAGTLLAILPYTLLAVMPVNRRLTSIPDGAGNQQVRSEVERWGKLHAGRTGLGIAATLTFLWATL